MNNIPTLTSVKCIEDPLPISCVGNLLTVSTTAPLPPGSRVQVDLSSGATGKKLGLSGKIVSIDTFPNNRFALKIRLHSVTKEEEGLLNSILEESK